MEIDEVAVNSALWKLAKAGDEAARNDLRGIIEGLTIYMHIMPVADDEEIVTLRQLEAENIVDTVKLNAYGAWR